MIRNTGKIRWHDERNGMLDDWVTAICRQGNDLYVGTFVGGLARQDGVMWRTVPELAGENVTALANGSAGELYVTTRHGTWILVGKGAITQCASRTIPLDPEAQALCIVPGGSLDRRPDGIVLSGAQISFPANFSASILTACFICANLSAIMMLKD